MSDLSSCFLALCLLDVGMGILAQIVASLHSRHFEGVLSFCSAYGSFHLVAK